MLTLKHLDYPSKIWHAHLTQKQHHIRGTNPASNNILIFKALLLYLHATLLQIYISVHFLAHWTTTQPVFNSVLQRPIVFFSFYDVQVVNWFYPGLWFWLLRNIWLGMSGQDSLGGPTHSESQDFSLYTPLPTCLCTYTIVWNGLSSVSHSGLSLWQIFPLLM